MPSPFYHSIDEPTQGRANGVTTWRTFVALSTLAAGCMLVVAHRPHVMTALAQTAMVSQAARLNAVSLTRNPQLVMAQTQSVPQPAGTSAPAPLDHAFASSTSHTPWQGGLSWGVGLAAMATFSALLFRRLQQHRDSDLTLCNVSWAMAPAAGETEVPMIVSIPNAPSWDTLRERVLATSTGAELQKEVELRAIGEGSPHTDCTVRLFGRPESEIRVTLYRDTAAWCPYCQKVWMLFEEKKIPYRIVKINMRSYGDKPSWFLNKIPSGLLPVIEIDGQMITESLNIMQLLDSMYSDYAPEMVPSDDALRKKAEALLKLERRLFGDWCSLIFRPPGFFGGDSAKKAFEATLEKVDDALGATPGPWFLGGTDPSLVDLQYLSHIERMLASCLYWKGMKIRLSGKYPNIDQWFDAFELRPSYRATKSDYYTHIKDIPPQYGEGYFDINDDVKEAREYLEGACWQLPLSISADSLEPLTAPFDKGEEAARIEAAFKLCSNHEAVARFAARGCGKKGDKRFQAPLSDPYATPNETYVPEMDAVLRSLVVTLLEGSAIETYRQGPPIVREGTSFEEKQNLVKCLQYLRDRVGVPRDMGFHAAMQLRAHLNEVIVALGGRA